MLLEKRTVSLESKLDWKETKKFENQLREIPIVIWEPRIFGFLLYKGLSPTNIDKTDSSFSETAVEKGNNI